MSRKKKELTAQEQFVRELAAATINGWKVGFQNLKDAHAKVELELQEKRAKVESEIWALQRNVDGLKDEISDLENARYFRIAKLKKSSSTKAFNLRKSTTGNLFCFRFPEKIKQPRLWYLNCALAEMKEKGLKASCLLVHPTMEEFMFCNSDKSRKYGDFRVFVTDKVSDGVVLIATL